MEHGVLLVLLVRRRDRDNRSGGARDVFRLPYALQLPEVFRRDGVGHGFLRCMDGVASTVDDKRGHGTLAR
jgi:hypothetical protein